MIGGRRIELLIPFDWQGKRVEAIELRPVEFGDQLRWQEGKFPPERTALALLADLTGLDATVLLKLRFPDIDNVMGQFMEHLPNLIRDDIRSGRNPSSALGLSYPPAQEQRAAPVPERPLDYVPDLDDDAGFDIADAQS